MVLLFLVTLSLLLVAVAAEMEAASAGPDLPEAIDCRCGQVLQADWLLCPRCRQRLQVFCSGCGKSFFGGLCHCPGCGQEKDHAGTL